ncbi:DUF1510 family protein [Bacillaceae bacterium Marseille-Q3522]|nr:DUF1510 family protein [Bacillaceae bacterium Marseille-Q3522]
MHDQSRTNIRAKRRKVNLILNSLIVLVLALIIIVSVIIFSDGGDQAGTLGPVNSGQQTNNENTDNGAANGDKNSNSDSDQSDNQGNENTDQANDSENNFGDADHTGSTDENDNDTDNENEASGDEDNQAIVTNGGDRENVKKTIVNPAWEPVGTSQTGEHVTTYGGVDWEEMEKAVSYATGLAEDEMTIWFMGNGGHNKSVATISSKDNSAHYKVYIEWVDSEGWKPTKVEELKERE